MQCGNGRHFWLSLLFMSIWSAHCAHISFTHHLTAFVIRVHCVAYCRLCRRWKMINNVEYVCVNFANATGQTCEIAVALHCKMLLFVHWN